MGKEFIDDKIEHIESDIEKIRRKPNMYISYLGTKGTLHLCKEIINNAIDECINPNSPAKNISIYVDEIDNAITVTDDGRGIPFDMIETVCSYLQAGSKFERDYGTTSGENGYIDMPRISAMIY
jgi:DNA gyrase/topoisomerase IV subunit B